MPPVLQEAPKYRIPVPTAPQAVVLQDDIRAWVIV